jgi:hypothetical protein
MVHYDDCSWIADCLESAKSSDLVKHSPACVSDHSSLYLFSALRLTAIDNAHDLLRFRSIPKIVYGLRRGSEQDTKMEALDMFVVP